MPIIIDQLSPDFIVLSAVLIGLAAWGIATGKGIFEFPTLVALLGIAWVLPQALEIEVSGSRDIGLDQFWIYVTLCFLAVVPGFVLGSLGSQVAIVRQQRRGARVTSGYDVGRLTNAAAAMAAFGLVNKLLVGGVDTSQMGTEWTGVITMYVLFENASVFGLCLAMLLFARTGSFAALCIALVSGAPVLFNVLTGVRRESLFDLVVLSAGAFYLARNRFPPRVAVLTCLLLGSFILNRVGEIRQYVTSGQGSFLDALQSPDLYAKFDYFNLNQGAASEVGLARSDFERMSTSGEFEYGASYVNALVNQYVPAFLVGRELKDSLMLDTLDRRARTDPTGIAFSTGSTRTGFSDTYRSFGWFGAAVFGVLGYIFGRLYAWAKRGGIREQYYYLILMGAGLKAITHSTSEFLSSLPFAVGISVLVFAYARSRQPAGTSKSTVGRLA